MRVCRTGMLLAAVVGAALLATPAAAQRVFVGAQGSDANPCTFALPCRTFQHAHDTVAAGGEIDVLDPAGYGALTISKAISIQGHGFAGLSVPLGGDGITISAGASDAISLNGLLIEGGITGGDGIVFVSGKALTVANCVVRNVAGHGLQFFSASLTVANSYFLNNAISGIAIGTSASPALVAIDRTVFDGNGVGLNVIGDGGTGALNVAATDSVASHNRDAGFAVRSAIGHSVTSLVLTHVTAASNNVGLMASGTNTTLRVSRSTVTANTTGFSVSGAVIFSYGDNVIDDNGGNSGGLNSAALQ